MDQGINVGLELVRTLMASMNLMSCHPRPWRITTLPGNEPGPKDMIKRDFTATRPGERFVGDITYVSTWEGWIYVATVIDLFTKQVAGWSIAEHMRTDLVCDAISMAARTGTIQPNAVFHSDRGCQYTSAQFAEHLQKNGLTGSMGRTGVCWDNALAESFFASLKKELIHRTVFPTRKKAAAAIANYIEIFYNHRRLHAGINYLTPAEKYRQYMSTNAA
jgi:transposase InsO family protein